jgi:hypothetical protein
MEDFEPAFPLERNPVTHRRHRSEVFWQITLPSVIGIVLIAALAFLATQTTSFQVGVWADISIIWLIMPVMMITLVSLVIMIASIYLSAQLIRILPFYSRRVQEWFSMLAIQVSRIDNIIIEPVLRVHGFRASIGMLGRNIRRK